MRIPVEIPQTAELFPLMRAELLRVLRGLSDDQWNAPTACAGWSVRDVALHIVGDDVGLLSGLRDADSPRGEFSTFADLVSFINARNGVWVEATRRMSRPVLLALLDFLGAQWAEYAASVDPAAPAGPIGWTGNEHDPLGLHLARELTEYWMHHQHICEAVGVTSLKDAQFRQAVLGTFIHCLPRTYAETAAPEGTSIQVVITGTGGGAWQLVREADRWCLYAQTDLVPTSVVTLDADTAWKLFTKGLAPEEISARLHVDGDQRLGRVMETTIAIIA